MKLIVGLGNPGSKYENTRHNLGFMVVERFLKNYEPVSKTEWEDDKKFKSETTEIIWQPRHGEEEKIILAKPRTYMNNSGLAVNLASSYYKIPTTEIWVIHDDVDLSFGSMKIRFGGASAGHHGVESVMEALGTDKFWRFRMGIGVKNGKLRVENSMLKNVEDFVLGEFGGKEKGKIRE